MSYIEKFKASKSLKMLALKISTWYKKSIIVYDNLVETILVGG